VIRVLEVLYVGQRCPEAATEIAARGGVVRAASHVYEGITKLRREAVGAVIVDFDELQPDPQRAVAALRESAGTRPIFVAMTQDEWDSIRARGFIDHEEALVRPFYPEEVWLRLTRAVLPAPSSSISALRGRADRLTSLIEDTQRLNRLTGDFQSLAEQTVEIVRARVRAGRVSLFLQERGSSEMRVVHAVGLQEESRAVARTRLGEGVAGTLAQERRGRLVRQAGQDGPATSRGYQRPSYMIVPLVHQHEVLGILCVTDRIEDGPFTDEDLSYLQAFADTAALTVQNAYQFRAADELATIDDLTGLFNRRYFNRALEQEVHRAQRYKHDLTLAMLDIDHFKLYNDSNGHQEGDRALVRIAEILRKSFRQTDIIVRFGGEEFAVIMPETSRKEGNGIEFVDRARRTIAAEDLAFDEGDVRKVLTISGGVATYPHQAATPEELVRRADQALYQAKRAGRNRIKGA